MQSEMIETVDAGWVAEEARTMVEIHESMAEEGPE